MEIGLFNWAYSEFDSLLNGYIVSTASNLAAAIAPTFWIMFGIYIVLWGFSMIRAQIDEPVQDGLFRILKIALVAQVALGSAFYISEVVSFFQELPVGLARYLVFDGQPDAPASLPAIIDGIIEDVLELANSAWERAGIWNGDVGMYFVAFVFAILGCVFTLLVFIMVMMQVIGLTLMLAIGPIFIIMAMFKTTFKFFENWLGQVVNFALTYTLILAVVGMMLGLIGAVIENSTAYFDADQTLRAMINFSAIMVLSIIMLFKVEPLGAGLAGGITMATSNAAGQMLGVGMARRAVGVAAAKASGGATAVAGLAMRGVGRGVGAAKHGIGNLARASNSIRPG